MTDLSTAPMTTLAIPTPTLPDRPGAGELAAALEQLYAACEQPPPVLLVADDPAALAGLVRRLQGLPGPEAPQPC